jgi:ribose/xylose/arabinose/galactoside ABC-type transport system permease subunit
VTGVAATAAPRTVVARDAWRARATRQGALVALVLLVVGNVLLTPGFATAGNAWNILLQVSSVVIVAVGMTFVIATGGIDLSVGAVMAIAAALAATRLEAGIPVALVMALAGGAAVGLVNGWFVAREGVQPIVVTLATLIAGRGVAQVLSDDGQLVPVRDATFLALGRGHVGPVPAPVIVAALVVALAAFVLARTITGRHVLAVGGNPVAARLAGVPVQRTLVTVYVGAALLAALAGLLEASRLGAADAAKIGLNIELDAIAATVVGGTALRGGRATIAGTVVGALVMQVIATSFNMLLVPYAWSLGLKAVLILLAVWVQRPPRA